VMMLMAVLAMVCRDGCGELGARSRLADGSHRDAMIINISGHSQVMDRVQLTGS
jgi:hypothetical protein